MPSSKDPAGNVNYFANGSYNQPAPVVVPAQTKPVTPKTTVPGSKLGKQNP